MLPKLETGSIIGLGLCSGTSADGIDAALVKIERSSDLLKVRTLAYHEKRYPPELSRNIMGIASGRKTTASEISRMNYLLGELFADAAKELIEMSSVDKRKILFIASHGQTVCHNPEPIDFFGRTIKATMQIGEPSIIAKRTGIVTVADFRADDVAVGGEGAPLLPYVDYLLFSSKEASRLVQNIGGIANLTYIPKNCEPEEIMAFDTGPGNMVIDQACSILFGEKMRFDEGGELALKGRVCRPLLDELLENAYFARKPPKSCGRLDFGGNFALNLINRAKRAGINDHDIIATASMLTVETIAKAYDDFILSRGKRIDELIVTGGGASNEFLVRNLLSRLPPSGRLLPVESFGMTARNREAVSFAVLGYLTLKGEAGNLQSVTGAGRRVVLGKICYPN